MCVRCVVCGECFCSADLHELDKYFKEVSQVKPRCCLVNYLQMYVWHDKDGQRMVFNCSMHHGDNGYWSCMSKVLDLLRTDDPQIQAWHLIKFTTKKIL